MIKRFLSIICIVAILCSLTGCSNTDFDSLPYIEPEASDIPIDTLVAENGNFTLEINTLNMGLVLTDKNTGEVWKTTPDDAEGPQVDEFGMPIKKHPRVESILSIECVNFVSGNDKPVEYFSYTDVVQLGKITHERIDNGMIINFFFSDAQVMIPLECTLTEQGVKLRVDPNKIMENDNKVVGVSIAPYFCGVKNDSKNSYIFVPSGSGALVDVSSKSVNGIKYTAQFYGNDLSIDEAASTSTSEAVRLNVLGSKTDNRGLCAIVDSSASSAQLNVIAGSTNTGYTTAYPSFIVRGYTNHVAELYSYEKIERKVYAKKKIVQPLSVSYYPLKGEDANYSGMADVYRDYLIDNYGMSQTAEDVPLNIRLIGGMQTQESFLGIPYKTVYAATTLSDAEKIMNELKDKLGNKFTMQLKGYGESGVDVGKIAGNYKVSSELGSTDELNELYALAKKNNIGLYFDFDMVRFNQNSSGVSKFFDAATNAGELKATQYYYDIAVRDKKTDTAYNLLAPSKFTDVFDKISKNTAKLNLYGVSLDTLVSSSYSDYADKNNSKYYSKNSYAEAAGEIVKKFKAQSKKFMASAANDYAAVYADIITEAPVSSDKSHAFMCDVPFYQMVFKGSVPITIQSINLAANPKEMILKAVESGSGLGYTVIDSWDSAVINSNSPYFYNTVYGDLKKDIYNNTKTLSSYYNSISGQHIEGHTILENGLRETVFENGVVAYVNYTDKPLASPAGEVAASGYLITEK